MGHTRVCPMWRLVTRRAAARPAVHLRAAKALGNAPVVCANRLVLLAEFCEQTDRRATGTSGVCITSRRSQNATSLLRRRCPPQHRCPFPLLPIRMLGKFSDAAGLSSASL